HDLERLRGPERVHSHADERDDGGEQDPAVGDAVAAHGGGEAGGRAVDGHGAQDSAGRVEAGVEAGQRRGQHDEVHHRAGDHPGLGRADVREERDEGGLARLVGAEGEQEGEQQDGADVEDRDPDDDGVDRARHDLLGVRGLACRGSDELDRRVGEDHARDGEQRCDHARGEEPAVVRDHREAGGAGLGGSSEDEEAGADDEEGHESGHLDHREPELHLAEELDADEIEGEHDHEGDEGDHPLRHRLERLPVLGPELDVERGGGDVDDRGHGPVEEVQPPAGEGELLAVELPGVGHERARGGPVQHQLAESAQDQEGEEAAQGVDEDERGAAGGEAPARSHEQPRPDRPADRDHLDLSRAERLVIPRLLVGEVLRRHETVAGELTLVLQRVCRVSADADMGIVHGMAFREKGDAVAPKAPRVAR
ncbi:hypothetical protein ABE10_01375, partial [Bacillus toyonensis]|nr:hypothetical protein [Bacillus toyonensis]